jgi:large repetitive protein
VKAYFDRPRLILISDKVKADLGAKTAALLFAIDLRRDSIRAVPFPGQSTAASRAFNAIRGISESTAERDAFSSMLPSDGPQMQGVSAASIFEAASAQGIGFVAITSANLSALDALDISAEAKARITAAAERGKGVIVPTRSVTLNGSATIGWYEVDPGTGETIGVTEDGGHGWMDGVYLIAGFLIAVVLMLAVYDLLAAPILGQKPILAKLFESIVKILGDLINNVSGSKSTIRASLASASTPIEAAGPSLFDDAFVSLLESIVRAPLANVAGPQVCNLLFSPAASGAFDGLAGSGVAASIIPDPQLTVSSNGAQVPTAFKVGIKNLGSSVDTFALNFTNVPVGFMAKTSVPSVQIPLGQIAEIGVYLIPTGGVSAPGTPASFSLQITSTTNAAVTTTDTEPFTVPEVHGVTLSADPPALGTIPGTPAETTLTLQAVGNVPENGTFDLDLPPGLSADGGLSPISLAVGETATQTLRLTPSSSTPLNSTLTATVNADFGAPEPQTLVIPVRVVVPGADAIAEASVAAGQLGNTDLANRLNDLSSALTNLVQTPTSDVFKSQALANLDSVISLLANDPTLSGFVGDLTAAKNALAGATAANEIQAAANQLGAALDSFATTATDLAQHNFEAFLLPNSQVAQPQTPAVFELRLHNIGTDTTTYNVSLGTLPAGVQGQVSQASVTLDRDGLASINITLTQTSTTELLAFNFEVIISVEGATEMSRSVPGALTVRNEVVSVVAVTADPPFTDPGGQVTVSARLLNTVNQEQQVLVSYVVKDSTAQTVFTSQPVQTALTVQTSLTTVNLGVLNTTGFALGDYTLLVSVTKLNGDPIPGAIGEGNLLIGSPITASISVTPDTLPPGNGMVTNTLQISTSASFNDPFTLVGQSAVGGASSAVRHPDPGVALVYVCGNAGISLFDITDPAQPQFLKTVGSAATVCRIRGDRLVAMRVGNTTVVSIYSLVDPQNPQLLGSAPEIRYNFAQDLLVTDTHAFVTTAQLVFVVGNNDIYAQNGDVLSIDISDPTAPQLVDVLFNTNGTNNDGIGSSGGVDQSGGNFNMWQFAQADAQTLLVGSTTSTDGDTQAGTGIVRVLDISDPANLAEVGTVLIPGTVQVVGLTIQGNHALVVASSGGWLDFFSNDNLGFTGHIVLATLDISNPRNPQLIATQALTRPSRGINGAVALGNGKYAFSSLGAPGDNPQLFLADASDPANLIVSGMDVPANISFTKSTADNLLFTTSSAGLLIYDIGESIGIPVTARVQVPKNTGVVVVPNSFNVPPTEIIGGTNFDTLVWELSLASGNTGQTFTWQSTVNNLQPGETRGVTLGTTVDFFVQGKPGQLTLPPTAVASQQILSIAPPSQTVRPGEAAPYTLTVKNPTGSSVTYALSVQGVPQDWVNLVSEVTVPALGEEAFDLTLTSDPLAALAEYGFVATATANGTTGSVQAALILQGEPVLPEAETQARGVVVTLTPDRATAGQGTDAFFTVRVTNTGSETDTFDLSTALPAGFVGGLAQDPVEVPPGVSNFQEVALVLTPTPGTALGDRAFSVTAVSTQKPAVRDMASGTVSVVGSGVNVDLSPGSGSPGSTFQMLVKNTGQSQDTFDLSVGGPAGLVATLGTNSVTLAPGSSQNVSVAVGAINFAYLGSLDLVGTATSRGNTAVKDSDTAQVLIPLTKSMTAEFNPDTVTLPQPGSATFLLLVHNTGNQEDTYTAEITGVTGPVNAALDGPDGQPTQQIDLFRVPGLSNGALLLNTTLTTAGRGEVTVKVTSLTDGTIIDTSLAAVQTQETSGNHTPVVDAGPDQSAKVGQTISLAPATFTDADPADTHTATVDWGNGTQTGGTVNETNGNGTVTASHSYTQAGPFTVTVCVTDTHEASGCDTLTVTVTEGALIDPFLCYRTRSSKGDRCTAEAPVNAGGECEIEEECGGTTEETSFCVPPQFPRDLEVALADQFEPQARVFAVRKPVNLCNPAEVEDSELLDPDTHLRGYQVEATPGRCAAVAPQRAGAGCSTEEECGGTRQRTTFCVAQAQSTTHLNIKVTNHFHPGGELVVDTLRPKPQSGLTRLLVPSAKSLTHPVDPPGPSQVDPYHCYRVKVHTGAGPFPKNLRVTAVDQFAEPQVYRLKKPTRLCTPVEEDGEGIKQPGSSLLCYKVQPVSGLCLEGAPVHQGGECKKEEDCGGTAQVTTFCEFEPKGPSVPGIFVNNQFGPEQVDAIKEKELCVPSTFVDGN